MTLPDNSLDVDHFDNHMTQCTRGLHMSIADTDLMVISSVREVHSHGAQHTAYSKLHRLITAATEMSPEPPTLSIVAEERDTSSHRRRSEAPGGASHSAAEEHMWKVACAAALVAILVC